MIDLMAGFFWSGKLFNVVRRREFSALAVASLLAVPECLHAASAMQKVSIALAARPSLYHLPLLLADQLGYFKSEGLLIDWQDQESGLQAVQTLLQGQADVMAGAFEHTIDLQARGLNYRAFVLQGRTPQISIGLSTRKVVGMRTLSDIKGLKIGVSSVGSATHWMAQHWLRQAGLSPESVQFLELGSGPAVADALRLGVVDALCHVDPLIHYLEQKNDLRVLADTRTLTNTQRFLGGPMASSCLLARSDFLQKRADAAQGLVNGVVHALKWLTTAGPTDILKTIPVHHWMGDRALYLGAFEKVRDGYSRDGFFADEALQTAWRARAGRVTTDRANWTTLGRTYTNSFVQVAKKRFQV
ncbi:MAG: hypothetical protein EBQ86_09375 [Betaproteobacteria bacterium]|nr:hypothetical protein [Betaproteobacteria bacterium]